jgi:hypothetical protein
MMHYRPVGFAGSDRPPSQQEIKIVHTQESIGKRRGTTLSENYVDRRGDRGYKRNPVGISWVVRIPRAQLVMPYSFLPRCQPVQQ